MRAYARVSPKSAENHTFARKKNLYKPRFCLYDYSIQSRIYECDYDV